MPNRTTSIPVKLPSAHYQVMVGAGALDTLSEQAASLVKGRRALLVIDDQLPGQTISAAVTALSHAGFALATPRLCALETNKTLAQAQRLLIAAADEQLDRADLVVALGGGIVGDVAGFVAASYKRGLAVIQCPTTLLAMVDASVGGKTGVNLKTRAGLMKNLVGAFHQPSVVLADVRTLDSLEDRHLRAGLAECIKHSLIAEHATEECDMFQWTRDIIPRAIARDQESLIELVARNVRVKAAVVARDEREEASSSVGGRALLNLGHTFAHAIETIPNLSPDADPASAPLVHGEAVALGLIAAAHTSRTLNMLDESAIQLITETVKAAGLPTAIANLPDDATILHAMAHDKKAHAGSLRLVLLESIGDARVVENVADEFIAAGLAAIRA